jgi:pimeloyl-ACP methyl ester carboxylesterase
MVLLLVLVLALAGAALSAAVWLPLAPLVLVLVLRQGWRWADRLGVVWLSRSILFTDRLGKARDRTLPQRVRELAQVLIALERNDPAAEVVLVGHSSGSFVMVMLAAELRRQSAAEPFLSKLRLLSLGQNLANLALYPAAHAFRADLQLLAAEPRLPWRDCSSQHDLLCFAGVDPYRASGLPEADCGSYPQLELLDLRTPRQLRSRWQWLGVLFDLHFDYLRDPATGVDFAGLIAAEVAC